MKRILSILLLLTVVFSVDAAPVIGRRIAAPATAASSGGDPHWSSVQLLLHMNGTDGSTTFPDNSSSAHTVTAFGNAQIDTAQFKFGGASGLFDGSGDYLILPSSEGFDFQSDWTVECWVFMNSTAGTVSFVGKWQSDESFLLGNQGGTLSLKWGPQSNQWFIQGGSLTTGVWHHVAAIRSGNTFRIFLNGVVSASGTSAAFPSTNTSSVTIAAYESGGVVGFLDGYIDDVRITKGVARYTSKFTPPKQQFPDN